jgi:hypothetical protein
MEGSAEIHTFGGGSSRDRVDPGGNGGVEGMKRGGMRYVGLRVGWHCRVVAVVCSLRHRTNAYGHTTGNTPEPVRFQKLSLVRPS